MKTSGTLEERRAIHMSGEHVKIESEISDAVAYYRDYGGYLVGLVFFGKQANPIWHYRIETLEKFEEKYTSLFESKRKSEEFKKERRAKLKATGRGVEVGDVMVCSWGYDQTQCDFYQVVELVGTASIKVREIGCEAIEQTGPMAEYVKPVKDSFKGEAFTKRVKDGSMAMTSFSTARKTDWNDKHYVSWYR